MTGPAAVLHAKDLGLSSECGSVRETQSYHEVVLKYSCEAVLLSVYARKYNWQANDQFYHENVKEQHSVCVCVFIFLTGLKSTVN